MPRPALRDDQEKLLELDTRRLIYEHLEHSPGVHLRQLQRDLDIPLGTLEYHLHQLERRHVLVTRELSRLKGYFIKDGRDRRDRDVLYFLREEMPRRLALLVVDRPGISFRELSAQVPITQSTVSVHLKKLVHADIIAESKVGREKVFHAVEPQRIQRLVVEFKQSFVDDLVDTFADAWMDIAL